MSCLKSGQTELSHPVTCLAYGATISSKALFRGSRGQNSCSFHLFMLQLQFTDLLSSSFFSIFPVVPCVIEFPGPLRVPNYSCPPMLKIWKIMTGYLRYLIKYSCYWLWIQKLSWNIWAVYWPVRVALAAVIFFHHLLVGVFRVLRSEIKWSHRLLWTLAVGPYPAKNLRWWTRPTLGAKLI